MPEPYDYSFTPQAPASNTFLQGMQEARGLRAQDVALKLQQAKMRDMQWLTDNHSVANIQKMIIKHPELSEPYKQVLSAQSADEKKAAISQVSQVYNALLVDQPEVALQKLTEDAEAARNSGDEGRAKAAESLADIIEARPKEALSSAALYLATADPDKFSENFSKLEQERRDAAKAPAELTKAQAEASSAAVASQFAESNAAIDLRKKGWDITKIQEDIGINRQNTKIAAINAQLARETNDLKKQELQQKLDDAKIARDATIQEKAAAVESSQATIDNSLNTIDRLLKNPALKDVVGPLEGRAYYPNTGAAMLNPVLGTSAEDRTNALADIDTIKSQTFLSQLVALKNSSATGASGLGALSKEEGQKLIDGVQSLDTKQGEKQFNGNLAEIQRLLLKMRSNVALKYGVPDSIPDTPNAAPAPDEIDALVKKYRG